MSDLDEKGLEAAKEAFRLRWPQTGAIESAIRAYEAHKASEKARDALVAEAQAMGLYEDREAADLLEGYVTKIGVLTAMVKELGMCLDEATKPPSSES